MPRTARTRSESDVYHVTARGVGRQLIFEDDRDRAELLSLLAEEGERLDVKLFAWCLMGNHVHLLVRSELDELAAYMRKILGRYAMFFNVRHGRSGTLFQERFHSEPVSVDEHFLAAVRYIHDNPAKAGIAAAQDYRWSSYGEYVGDPVICDTSLALDMLGGKEEFVRFHESGGGAPGFYDVPSPRLRLDDEAAIRLVRREMGGSILSDVAKMGKPERDEALAEMRRLGLSVRQIQRLTGIGFGIISRAKA